VLPGIPKSGVRTSIKGRYEATYSVARYSPIAERHVLRPPQGIPQSEQYRSTFTSNITSQTPDCTTFLEDAFRKANTQHEI